MSACPQRTTATHGAATRRHTDPHDRHVGVGVSSNIEPVNITQALADVRSRRAQLIRQQDELRTELAEVTMQVDAAKHEEQVLRSLAERYHLEVPDELEPLSEEVREWLELTRTAAVERVLAAARKPLSPTEVTQALADKGREDSASHVGAALAHLKSQGKATQKARGQWVRKSRATSQAGSLPAIAALAAAMPQNASFMKTLAALTPPPEPLVSKNMASLLNSSALMFKTPQVYAPRVEPESAARKAAKPGLPAPQEDAGEGDRAEAKGGTNQDTNSQ